MSGLPVSASNSFLGSRVDASRAGITMVLRNLCMARIVAYDAKLRPVDGTLRGYVGLDGSSDRSVRCIVLPVAGWRIALLCLGRSGSMGREFDEAERREGRIQAELG